MEAFTASYLSSLTSKLKRHVLKAVGRHLRKAISGSKKQRALERCLHAGVVALLATASTSAKEELDRLANIFRNFFNDRDVGKELAVLLKGKPFDSEELSYLFEQICSDIDILPDVDFDRTITAFEAAFLTAAADEPDLQRVIQAKQLWTLPERETLEIMRELVKFLRQVDIVDIRNGKITAQSKGDGKQVAYQLPRVGIFLTEENWEEYYLRTAIRQCDPLDLTPLNETHPQGVQRDEANIVSVSEVFIPLYLAHLTRSAKQDVATIIRQKNESNISKQIEAEEKPEPIQAVEAVAAMPRLVILGQQGGGKSTLVNYITTQLARRRLGEPVGEEKLPGWPEDEIPLPVCVILRRFANWLPTDLPDEMADLVWNYIEKQMEQWGCKQAFPFLKQQLMKEGGIIFFDGLDEVHETNENSKRPLVNIAIAAFAALQEKFRIVITCRKYAYDQDKENHVWQLPENDFPVVELALFNLNQIKAFTQCWYQVVGPQRGWNQQKCHDESTKLYHIIENWPHLQELAQLPLLLTLISQMHCRHGNLPENIAELYERVIALLVEHWENRIVRERSGVPKTEPGFILGLGGISMEKLRSSLEHVAFVAQECQEGARIVYEPSPKVPRKEQESNLIENLAMELEVSAESLRLALYQGTLATGLSQKEESSDELAVKDLYKKPQTDLIGGLALELGVNAASLRSSLEQQVSSVPARQQKEDVPRERTADQDTENLREVPPANLVERLATELGVSVQDMRVSLQWRASAVHKHQDTEETPQQRRVTEPPPKALRQERGTNLIEDLAMELGVSAESLRLSLNFDLAIDLSQKEKPSEMLDQKDLYKRLQTSSAVNGLAAELGVNAKILLLSLVELVRSTPKRPTSGGVVFGERIADLSKEDFSSVPSVNLVQSLANELGVNVETMQLSLRRALLVTHEHQDKEESFQPRIAPVPPLKSRQKEQTTNFIESLAKELGVNAETLQSSLFQCTLMTDFRRKEAYQELSQKDLHGRPQSDFILSLAVELGVSAETLRSSLEQRIRSVPALQQGEDALDKRVVGQDKENMHDMRSTNLVEGLAMELGVSVNTLRKSLQRGGLVTEESYRKDEASQAWSLANFPKQDMVEVLTPDFGSVYEAERAIAYLQDRAGLLFRMGFMLGFTSRHFQEYLAAGYILRQTGSQAVLNSLMEGHPARWKRVAGFADAKAVWDVALTSHGRSAVFGSVQEGPRLVELPSREKRRDQSKSEASALSLFAIARVDLEFAEQEEDERALVGKTYSVYAGVSSEQPEGFVTESFRLIVPDKVKTIPLDILIHTSRNIELTTDWYKRLDYNPYNPDIQLAEFTFKAITQGRCFLILDFYYERRWLRTIQFDFDSVAAS